MFGALFFSLFSTYEYRYMQIVRKIVEKDLQALSRLVKITYYHIRNSIKNLYVRKKSEHRLRLSYEWRSYLRFYDVLESLRSIIIK